MGSWTLPVLGKEGQISSHCSLHCVCLSGTQAPPAHALRLGKAEAQWWDLRECLSLTLPGLSHTAFRGVGPISAHRQEDTVTFVLGACPQCLNSERGQGSCSKLMPSCLGVGHTAFHAAAKHEAIRPPHKSAG